MTSRDDEVRALLAEAAAVSPPPELAVRVVAGAAAVRDVGRPIEALGGGRAADPVDAFVRTVRELDVTLATAGPDLTVQPYGWSVSQLLAHLIGVERYFGHRLGLWPLEIDVVLEDDHLAMTAAAVDAARPSDRDALFQQWRTISAAVCDHLRSAYTADLLRRPVKFHFLETRLSTILVVRIFELWTHTEDLCRAAGEPVVALDAERLRLMTQTAVAAIPFGLLLAGVQTPDVSARLVLTGPGGGVWNQPLQLGGAGGEPDVTLVAGALDFCRLAAQRIDAGALLVDVEGDAALVQHVLRGASVFAA